MSLRTPVWLMFERVCVRTEEVAVLGFFLALPSPLPWNNRIILFDHILTAEQCQDPLLGVFILFINNSDNKNQKQVLCAKTWKFQDPNECTSHVDDEIFMLDSKPPYPVFGSLKMYRSIWKGLFGGLFYFSSLVYQHVFVCWNIHTAFI